MLAFQNSEEAFAQGARCGHIEGQEVRSSAAGLPGVNIHTTSLQAQVGRSRNRR